MKQGSPEWVAQRRNYITSTDIPAILGLSPFRCEQDVADEKNGIEREVDPKTARMFRIGHGLESVIRAEDEAEHGIKLRHVERFFVHPTIPWAGTSLDYERVGEKCIVEAKSSNSRDWDNGIPQYVEAQVRWQMGVAGYPKVHVACLRKGRDLECYDLTHDPEMFDWMVEKGADFQRRRAEGGPFAQSDESMKRQHPKDNGTVIPADPSMVDLARQWRAAKENVRSAQALEDTIKSAVRLLLRDASEVDGLFTYRYQQRVTTDFRAAVEAAQKAGVDLTPYLSAATKQDGTRYLRLAYKEGENE